MLIAENMEGQSNHRFAFLCLCYTLRVLKRLSQNPADYTDRGIAYDDPHRYDAGYLSVIRTSLLTTS